MNSPVLTRAVADNRLRIWEDRLAAPMFSLAVLFLVVLAGVIHRFPRPDLSNFEAHLIEGGLSILWSIFLVEAVVRFRLRDRGQPVGSALASAAVCGLLPPLRMGIRSWARPNHIWLPWLGWQEISSRLRRTLERIFSVPMVFFALMVLPLLAVEYYQAEKIRAEPIMALWLDIGTSLVWLAFAIELIVMLAVADRRGRYCLLHWIDVAIVLLPLVESLPLLRLLRVGRILRLEQLLRWGRLYRLKILLARGWRAFLLLQIIQRLTGRTPERRLKRLQELLHAKEEEVSDLRREICELQDLIPRNGASRKRTGPTDPNTERACSQVSVP